jgi:hypothetical protein
LKEDGERASGRTAEWTAERRVVQIVTSSLDFRTSVSVNAASSATTLALAAADAHRTADK